MAFHLPAAVEAHLATFTGTNEQVLFLSKCTFGIDTDKKEAKGEKVKLSKGVLCISSRLTIFTKSGIFGKSLTVRAIFLAYCITCVGFCQFAVAMGPIIPLGPRRTKSNLFRLCAPKTSGILTPNGFPGVGLQGVPSARLDRSKRGGQ